MDFLTITHINISAKTKEFAVDKASSFVPKLSGAVTGFNRIRFEQNIKKFADELLNERVQQISKHLGVTSGKCGFTTFRKF